MTTLSADESALQAEFAKVDVRVSEVSVLAKGVELCATFGIDTKDLVTQWEALALSSSKKERKVELGDLETLSKQFAAKRPVKPDPRSSGSKNRKINLGGLLGTVTESPTSERLRRKEFAMDLDEPVQTNLNNDLFASPASQRTPQSPTKYSQRKEGGKVINTMNPTVPQIQPNEHPSQVAVEVLSQLRGPYQHMWEQPEKQQSMLDARISVIEDELIQRFNLEPSQSWHLASQETVVAVGMIAVDEDDKSDSSSVNVLTPTNLVLQSKSNTIGEVVRVRLDLIELKECDLFPGQVVAIEGVNPYGSRLIVKRIFSDATPPLPSRLSSSTPLTIVVAAGPFTSTEDLTYEPLSDLLTAARAHHADCVVLCGPFIDASHPAIMCGDMEGMTTQSFFEKRILSNIREVGPTKVVLIPSTKDAFLSPVLPQPCFYSETFTNSTIKHGDLTHITYAPNPAVLRLNGVSLGVCSSDILWHLNKVALSRQLAVGDQAPPLPKRVRLLKSVISQRSFYPLWPPHGTHDEPIGIASSMSSNLELPFLPNLLIFPSQHPQFAHDVDGVVCVNPGRLVVRESGGTYAVVHFHPSETSTTGKARVDIVRV